ncbi:ABC transporter permease [Faecalicoccus pleomorphus]|uniref:ABC transporter permease protein n=1 Tax=Faecalicoccus pleomorphus TaxID=1323 RepID=A0A380LQS8_9FIRM|nr:ABC transporter permease [Faecalicoccus pleomorphus]MBM6678450.1 ABC transporter permease [Faecalicoccus pleomorphus]MBM6766070.1 ABC transporter permease [Faecalicoccus pleomorphus]MBM6809124.1 ABC transporter permease [Faecalicoccus pleomorphus]MDB7986508.1 ABC transporter permease [Faecalicoccus pleomorphus]MDB7990043.1 ABC transporter permease [Faecalicoccus pleomorphus]
MGIVLAMQGALSQGILWGLMALGVYITFRLLDIADLTVDGSFATGGAVCAVCLVNGVNPVLALILSTIAGFIAGFVTGLLHTKCQIPAILAGILTQIGLYSINLRIMGRSNTPLLQYDNIFEGLENLTGLSNNWIVLIIGLIVTVLVILILYWYFGTEIGSSIRATGNNEQMVRALGVNTNVTKTLGLMISNGLIALSGALVTQQQGYADVRMGIGAIVIGLASIVIGEVIFGHKGAFGTRLTSIVVGSVIYRIIVAVVLQLGLNTDDLKLLTAILVAIALTVPIVMNKHKQLSMYKKLTGKER